MEKCKYVYVFCISFVIPFTFHKYCFYEEKFNCINTSSFGGYSLQRAVRINRSELYYKLNKMYYYRIKEFLKSVMLFYIVSHGIK